MPATSPCRAPASTGLLQCLARHVRGSAQRQNGAWGEAHRPLGNAAEQDVLDPRPSVRPHDDEVRLALDGGFDDADER
jgi:hypothetical protein